jgi:hypothetical protein
LSLAISFDRFFELSEREARRADIDESFRPFGTQPPLASTLSALRCDAEHSVTKSGLIPRFGVIRINFDGFFKKRHGARVIVAR